MATVQTDEILARLRAMGDPTAAAEQARVGISGARALGITVPRLRDLAREIGRDHEIALVLWDSGVHEARILAAMIDDPALVTEEQMERWVRDFDSWDLCDGCCGDLFDRTPWAYDKAAQWSAREEEFVKRAGFVLMAQLAVHDKAAPDERFRAFLPLIRREAGDDRNFVKKAVNWALRQIGKRNPALNQAAIACAREIRALDAPAARWIAGDALRELASESTQARLAARAASKDG